MKRVLLTGASGFIGRQALPLLLKQGYEVHAISMHSTGTVIQGVTWHTANLLNAKQRRALIDAVQPTHILHFAWIATPGIYWTSPLNIAWHEATVDLLQLGKKSGVCRFVGTGTCAEYDWSTGQCDEMQTPLKPTTIYGMEKAACGQHIINAQNEQMSTAWGRIFLTYGPHEHPTRLVPTVILSLLRQMPAQCTDCSQIRDILYVKDVASAFVALLDSPTAGGINIASGVAVPLRTVIEKIMNQFTHPELITFGAIPRSANDPESLTATTKRLTNEVQWQPSYSQDAGISETIAWWKSTGSSMPIMYHSLV